MGISPLGSVETKVSMNSIAVTGAFAASATSIGAGRFASEVDVCDAHDTHHRAQ